MKITAAIIAILTIKFAGNCGFAQSNQAGTNSVWGHAVEGVHLSISATNLVIDRSSSLVIQAVLENESTNIVGIGESTAAADFDLLLTNGAGKSYNLRQTRDRTSFRSPTISPEGKRAFTIPLQVGTYIAPGDYTLIAAREFGSSKGRFRVESNPLKVQVK
jgi:hypothetical protein